MTSPDTTKDSSGEIRNFSKELLRLEIKGLGHIPSKKNQHYAALMPNGKPRVLMDKETKERCKAITHNIASQLLSGSATKDCMTLTVARLRFLIASLPPDDNWRDIPLLILSGAPCDPGDEGCTITIRKMLI